MTNKLGLTARKFALVTCLLMANTNALAIIDKPSHPYKSQRQQCMESVQAFRIHSSKRYSSVIQAAIEINNRVIEITLANHFWVDTTIEDIANHFRHLYEHGPQPKQIHHEQQAFFAALEKYKEALRTAGLLRVAVHEDNALPIPTRAMHSAQQSLDYIAQTAKFFEQGCINERRKEREMPIY